MRVALLTNGLFPETIGGMQKHSTLMAQHLAALGISVDVYASDVRERMGIDTECGRLQIQINRVSPVERRRHPGHYLAECYALSKKILRSYRDQLKAADLIYIQGFSGWALLDEIAAGETYPPTLLNFHGLGMFQRAASVRNKLENWMFRPWIRRLVKKADYVQSLGGQLTSILGKWKTQEQVIVQGIGIPAEWTLNENQTRGNRLRICFIGRYERPKGIEELGEAIETLDQNDRFELSFIGPIPRDKQINAPHVTYLGEIRDSKLIQAELRNSDVLICPSYSEGMPTVILEAMACGCAIIATDVGAVSALVDESNGWLLPWPKPTMIREAIQQAIALSDSSLRSMQATSRARVQERFTWEIVAEQMAHHFREICDKRSLGKQV